jgi:hypothetical protein
LQSREIEVGEQADGPAAGPHVLPRVLRASAVDPCSRGLASSSPLQQRSDRRRRAGPGREDPYGVLSAEARSTRGGTPR